MDKPVGGLLMENFNARASNVAGAAMVNLSLNARGNFIKYADYRFIAEICK